MKAINNYTSFSLSKEYFIFCFITVIIIVTMLFWFSVSTYSNLKSQKIYNYSKEADKVILSFEEAINYTSNFLNYIGEKLKYSDKNDIDSISSILKTNINVNQIKIDVLPWTLFEFVNNDNYAVASTNGRTPAPLKVDPKARPWLKTAREQPWKLHLTDPDIGIVSKEYIIPGGYGITDPQGNFIGIISVGFNIKKILQKVSLSVSSESISFIILTNNNEILRPDPISLSNTNSEKAYFDNILKQNNYIHNLSGKLTIPIEFNKITYRYYKKINPYKYIVLIGESDSYLKKEFTKIVMPQIIISINLAILFLIILYIFRRNIVNPMIILSEKALLLSQGNTDIALPELNSIEAKNLVAALRLVKKTLKNEKLLRDEVIVTNQLLESNVKDRTLELEKALASKSEFLNNMSHEIRTPIHAIMNFSDAILENWESLSEKEKLLYIEKIQNSSNSLLSLTTNLLDLSVLNSGKMNFYFETNDLSEVLDKVIYEMDSLYKNNKNLEVKITKEPNFSYLASFDQIRITQVIRNLLSNAIKFTDKGTIKINLTRSSKVSESKEQKFLEFSIEDEGIGIPSNELDDVFDKFGQSSRTKNKAGGAGLGLAICKEIINAHKGKIWAENNPRKGVIFKFIIPKL